MLGTVRAVMIGAMVLSIALQVEAASIQSSGALAIGCSVGASPFPCTPSASQVGTTGAVASLNTTDAYFHYSGTSRAYALGGGTYDGTDNSIGIDSVQYSQYALGFLTAESKASASDAIFLYVPSGSGTIVFTFTLSFNNGQNGGSGITFDGNSYIYLSAPTRSVAIPFTNGVPVPYNVTVVTDTSALLGQSYNLCCEDSAALFSLNRIQVLDQMNNPVQQYGYRTASGFNLGFVGGTEVPEPCTVLLLLSGGAALLLKRNCRAI